MVVVQLMGGLGNQLFQAAAGIALSKAKMVSLAFYFDDSYQYAKRSFALEPFKIDYRQEKQEIIQRYIPQTGYKRRLHQLLMLPVNGKIYREKQQFCFDEDFFNLSSEIYLSGFWQSYKYHEHYKLEILSALAFKDEPHGLNLECYQQIKTSHNSVSLHFRRGDYTNPKSDYYCLPLSYYKSALNRLEQQLGDLTLFIFSDDQDWVKKTFETRHSMTFVDHNDGASAHEDLRLMAACDHNIIANSSLSWWGAYLNSNKAKLVYVPELWNSEIRVTDVELIPENWHVI